MGSVRRSSGSVAVRRADHRHRIQLLDNAERGCWSLVVTGPHQRNWGFWCGRKFIPWQAFGADGCDTASQIENE